MRDAGVMAVATGEGVDVSDEELLDVPSHDD